MIRQMLGIFDIICALILIASSFIPSSIIKVVATYMIIKGVLFGILLAIGFGGLNFVSIIDGIIGVYLLLGISVNFFNVVFFVFLIQKGVFSLF